MDFSAGLKSGPLPRGEVVLYRHDYCQDFSAESGAALCNLVNYSLFH